MRLAKHGAWRRAGMIFVAVAVIAWSGGTRADDAPPATQPTTNPAADGPRVKAHSDRKPRGLQGVGLTPAQVNEAIEHGRDSLWEHLRAQLAKENRRLGEDHPRDRGSHPRRDGPRHDRAGARAKPRIELADVDEIL